MCIKFIKDKQIHIYSKFNTIEVNGRNITSRVAMTLYYQRKFCGISLKNLINIHIDYPDFSEYIYNWDYNAISDINDSIESLIADAKQFLADNNYNNYTLVYR